MKKKNKPKTIIDKRLKRRLVIKYWLIFSGVLLSGILVTLFYAAIKKNYFQGDEDIVTMFTKNVYTLVIFFLSLVMLFLLFKIFVYQTAYNDAKIDNKDEVVALTEVRKIEGKNEPTDKQVMSVSDFPSPALHENVDAEEQSVSGSRFPGLGYIDSAYPELVRVSCDPSLTLESFCYNFRQYCAGELGLFYSAKDIRSFVAGLGTSRILLLQGMSGTGKTSLPVAFGKFIQNPTSVIPVQPTWKERSDLLGYYNEFTGKFSETPLLTSLYKAGTTDSLKLVVLDEVNIARIEYYFAEFLSLLELPDQNARILQVASSKMDGDPKRMIDGAIMLPENVWFVGTANNDDSTFAVSDKVYDRAFVLDLDRKAEPFRAEPYSKKCMSLQRLRRLSNEAVRRYGLTNRDLSKIGELDMYLQKTFSISFGNRIMRQIRTFVPIYVACGGDDHEALDVILARKVMRKLSSVNPVLLKSHLDELLSRISELFVEGGMEECAAVIKRFSE